MRQDTEIMSSYTLSDTAEKLVITFSEPVIAYISSPTSHLIKLQATMTITGGTPSPSRSIDLIGYTGANSIADGLDIVGKPVSSLQLQLDSSNWPEGWIIQANTDTLSNTNPSALIKPESSGPTYEISIVFNFAGLVSGDPKIKVIPPH